MKKPSATIEDVCEHLDDMCRILKEGLGTNFGDMTPLHGIALSLHEIEKNQNGLVCALERIADALEAQEKARTV